MNLISAHEGMQAPITLQTEVPGFVIKPTILFTYPTRTADIYTPQIEHIHLPQEDFPAISVTIQVAIAQTAARQSGGMRWKTQRLWEKVASKTPTLECAEKFVFDARMDTDKNIAHVLDNICPPVLLAKQLLSEHLDKPIDIHVILNKDASQMALRVYDTLDIPVICTDYAVRGHVVTVSPHIELFNLQPKLFDRPIKNYNPNTPARIFVPRKGNRQLVNNDEITQLLEKKGFTTIYFENLTPSEQWSIARNAKEVVAVHGAGTSHFIFNRLGLDSAQLPESGIRMVELISPNFALTTYRTFSTLLNGRWCAVRGQITPEALRYLDFTNKPRHPTLSPMKDAYKIAPQSLQLALEYLEID
jgi:Glycosyltransferase 61